MATEEAAIAFTAEIKGKNTSISFTFCGLLIFPQVLIHSAAASISKFKLTADNLEGQMGTNYIAAFLLTKRGDKSVNVMTAIELSKRSKGKIKAYSLDPSGILGAGGKLNPNFTQWKTIPQGAATIIAAAFLTNSFCTDVPGAYLSDSIESNKNVAAHNSDPIVAQKVLVQFGSD
ncbi:hypothetical protein B0H14DRAFT_3468804 [Mycena olivaceomarginata]|nr:hypothetical protein B0H14DRAFT_3468804 [Mycena olivaceomarginata]